MRGQRLWVLLDDVASAAVPELVDLWPRISSRVGRVRNRRRRGVAVRVLAGVALLGALTASPVRASVGETLQHLPFGWVQRFGTVLVDPTQLLATQTQESGAKPAVEGPFTPSLSLGEAQREVDFPIRTPSWLPAGVVFRGALVAPDGTVVVSYRSAGDTSAGLGIQIHKGKSTGGYVVPSSAAQEVRVKNVRAVYAHGSWDRGGAWKGNANAALLSWEEDGFTFVVQFSGLQLTREDLIRIAESLQ